MSKKLIVKFILIYILLISVLTAYFISSYLKNKDSYLDQKTNQHLLEYKAIYNEHKDIANLIYDTDINTTDIKNIFKDAYKSNDIVKDKIRKKLHKKLETKYAKLKEYNLKQLHFHLPNNDSFLRMHRPNKFGDNLSSVRATVKYVNENKKYVDGFEEGRIFNGFRFVYPMFSENKEHIGSVEISFSALALVKNIRETYKLNSTFLIRKDIVDAKVFEDEKKNYILSPNKNFYFEKSVYEAYPPVSITPSAQDMTKKMLEGTPFTVFVEKIRFLRTVLPIKNPISDEVVAALCICEKDDYILNIKNNLIITLLIIYLSFAVIFYLFFKQRVSNIKLNKLNKDLDKKISIEIKKSRKKDISILNNAKMTSIADMLNNIGHQWRQPLNLISTSASGLKIHQEVNTLDDKTFKSLTDSIIDQCNYLSKTIENFKEYLHQDQFDRQSLSLDSRVDKALEMIDETLKYNYIITQKEYCGAQLLISANPGELIQVILNILNNAKDVLIKNNDINDRRIQIKIKEKAKGIGLITIEDNGGGIPEEIIDKIFDPYFTTKHESMGIGISLYVSYEIITNNFKGKLYVKNKNGGARFYIELPLID